MTTGATELRGPMTGGREPKPLPNGEPAGDVMQAITSAFGSYEAWEAEFRRTAMSLAGGSGWCLLTYNMSTNELRNRWASDHMHGAIAGLPLLALDMYEHSYHMDHGTAAAKYLDALMRNVNWEEMDRRFSARRRRPVLLASGSLTRPV